MNSSFPSSSHDNMSVSVLQKLKASSELEQIRILQDLSCSLVRGLIILLLFVSADFYFIEADGPNADKEIKCILKEGSAIQFLSETATGSKNSELAVCLARSSSKFVHYFTRFNLFYSLRIYSAPV